MGETLDTTLLKNLPAWKTLAEAKQQKLRLLEQTIARNLGVSGGWSQRVFRLVLEAEPENRPGVKIEQVELGSPLGMALLGITPGEEFRIGLGPDHGFAEVEDVL